MLDSGTPVVEVATLADYSKQPQHMQGQAPADGTFVQWHYLYRVMYEVFGVTIERSDC